MSKKEENKPVKEPGLEPQSGGRNPPPKDPE